MSYFDALITYLIIIDSATRPEGGGVIFTVDASPRGRPSRDGSDPILPPLLTELLVIENPKLGAAGTYIADM